jgi:hypothetical protein
VRWFNAAATNADGDKTPSGAYSGGSVSKFARVTQSVEERNDAPARVTSRPAHELIGLQHAAGNQAVVGLLAQAQTKLVVGAAGDMYEREADAVARQVVKTLSSGEAAETEEEQEEAPEIHRRVQRKVERAGIGAEGGDLDKESEETVRSMRGRGAALPNRASFESALGADLSGVRVHTGPAATGLSEKMNATAFTLGSDIFFKGSAPNASSPAGQELLAHELTHVVQQGGAKR